MNIEIIKHVAVLHKAAQTLNERWGARECIDWSEAEEFVELINDLPSDIKSDQSEISVILDYSIQNDDWDSGEVANWPDAVISFSAGCAKAYDYRSCGDNWEVYSLDGTGSEEWKATTETESIAELLVTILQQSE